MANLLISFNVHYAHLGGDNKIVKPSSRLSIAHG